MLLPKLKLWGLTHTWVLKGTLSHGHGGWPAARDSHSPCFPFHFRLPAWLHLLLLDLGEAL